MKTSDYDAGGKIEEEALENDKEERLYAVLYRSAFRIGQLISELGDEKIKPTIECGLNAGIEQTKTTSKQ